MHQHEVNPGLHEGSRENCLYFTLPVGLNFQRSSPAMWQAALKTWSDESTRYLFYPEQVVKTDRLTIQGDLIKHKLGLQKNKHIDIWITLCTTFTNNFESDPRTYLKTLNYDVDRIVNDLRVTNKSLFPYLSGPKMANYWIYILHQFTDARFSNLASISIIPDTHVQQASIRLGITQEGASPDEVAEAWFELLRGTALIPIDIHPILWNWSRNGFMPSVD